MVEEGGKLQFVHNSVQEFFAAKYVKTRTEPVAASFYSQILEDGKWMQWQEELSFLKQIDQHRADRYFFTRDYEATFKYLLDGESSVSDDAAIKYLEGMSVKKIEVTRNGLPVTSYVISRTRPDRTYALQVLDSRVFNKLFTGTPWNKGFAADLKSMQRNYLQIAKDIGESELASLIDTIKVIISAQQKECSESLRRVAEEEATTGLINLDGL